MGKWLAVTWEGTLAKGLLGALLGALGSWLATADVHPLIVALGAAGIPVILNALSTDYHDYGRNKQPQPEEIATMHEFEIEGE
jgi:1,4-dihydroxy-2-naphthoate octaprenyltransferase